MKNVNEDDKLALQKKTFQGRPCKKPHITEEIINHHSFPSTERKHVCSFIEKLKMP